MEGTIRHWHGVCDISFNELCNASSADQSTGNLQISSATLYDEYGRFRVWAANIGAHQIGSVSLDHRLREASHIKEQVLKSLQYLVESLNDALDILHGDKVCNQDSISSDPESSVSSGSFTANAAEQTDGSPPSWSASTELELLTQNITNIIANLFKMSVVIRSKPVPHDRLIRSAKIDVSHFEPYDIKHAKEKFPLAKERIIDRLGRGISKRRQYLMYRERHHEKLSAPVENVEMDRITSSRTVNEEACQPQVMKSQVTEHKETSRPSFEDQIDKTLSKTDASTFIIPPEPQPVNLEQMTIGSDNGTQTSYASSSNLGFERPLIPPLPIASESRSEFECPLCYAIISLRGSNKYRQWKRHVFKDLQPYMCTFDDCSSPNTMYDSRRQWITHELRIHRREWSCNVLNHNVYSERSLFAAHMQQEHATNRMEGNLNVVVNMCERAMDSTTTVCPLCFGENAQNLSVQGLEKHLGSHLEALALFALPRNAGHDPMESPNFPIRSKIAFDGSESSRDLAALKDGSSRLSNRGGSRSERLSFGKPSPDHSALFNDSLESPLPNPTSLEDRRSSALMTIKRTSGEETQSLIYQSELSKTHEKTGQWFFGSFQYNNWKTRDKKPLPGNNVLLLSGIPGSGKSNICANVVKDLENMRDLDSGIGTAYMFLQNERYIVNQELSICRSLLSQMISIMPLSAMPNDLLNLLDKFDGNYDISSTAITPRYLDDILEVTFRFFQTSYIAIDALDADYLSADWIFYLIERAQQENYDVRFFLTSRVDIHVWLLFTDSNVRHRVYLMNTNSVNKDIKRYIRDKVGELVPGDVSRRQSLIDKIQDRCCGVFTWAVEQVEALALEIDVDDKLSPRFLPKGVSELWRSVLLARSILPADEALVASIFSRLYSVERPLALRALVDSVDAVEFGFSGVLSQISILNRCSAIVQLSIKTLEDLGENCCFEFIHPSIRIFLQPSRHPRTSPVFRFTVHESDSQYEIAQSCLTSLRYLSIAASDYLYYAAQYWCVHLKKVDDDRKNELQDLSYEIGLFHGRFSFWLETYDPDRGKARETAFTAPPTPLYYASLLGLPRVISRLLNQGSLANAPGGRHNRPLLAAIEADSAAAVTLLLSESANCNARYKNKDTGLMRAIIKRNNKQCEATLEQNDEIVQRLLDAGANLEFQSRRRKETALHLAVQTNSGDISIVKKLLGARANIEARDALGRTPLVWAAQYDNKNAIRTLLDSGADVKVRDLFGNTVMHLSEYPMDTLRLLADFGAPLDSHNNVAGYTPLHDAIERGIASKVQALLQFGANIDVRTITMVPQTALQIATKRYSQADSRSEKLNYQVIIWRLLSHNASLEGWEDEGFLDSASEAGALVDGIRIGDIRRKTIDRLADQGMHYAHR